MQRPWQRVESTEMGDPGSSQTEYESCPPNWKYQRQRSRLDLSLSSQTEYETLPPSLDPYNVNIGVGGGARSRLSRFRTEDGDITVVNSTLPKRAGKGKESLGDYDDHDDEEDKNGYNQFQSQFEDDSQSQGPFTRYDKRGSPSGRIIVTSRLASDSLDELMQGSSQDSSQSHPRSDQDMLCLSQPLSVVPDSEGEAPTESSGSGESHGVEGSQLFPPGVRAFFHELEGRKSLDEMLKDDEEDDGPIIVDSQ